MLDSLFTIFCGVIVLGWLYYYLKLRRPSGFPPGPAIYPIMGSLPVLDVNWGDKDGGLQLLRSLNKLSHKYGPIYGMRVGHGLVVVIHDFALVKEAFGKLGTDTAARGYYEDMVKLWNPFVPKLGILDGSYDEQWKLQRHTAIQVLRNLGYGRSVTEAVIHEEADIMIDSLKQMEKEPIYMSDRISHAVANVIVNLLTGERFDFEDKGFAHVRHNLDIAFENLQKIVGFVRVVGGTWLPQYKRDRKVAEDAYKEVHKFMHQKLAENKLEEGVDEPRNFLEGYQMERAKNPKLEDRLFQLFMDFITAGMETTTTTLSWSILFMITYPEVQKKVQKELDEVVGRGRRPKLSDRASLPYTLATLQEILRISSTVPITIPHVAMKTCEVGGFTIPKGTEFWAVIWDVLRDPKTWPDPLVLKPERFLDAEGQVIQPEEFIPFSLGRRSCLGEQLARQELFIFFSNLLQNFTFTAPEGSNMKPVSEGVFSITHKPPEYKAMATRRA